jgi:hypothetical protein
MIRAVRPFVSLPQRTARGPFVDNKRGHHFMRLARESRAFCPFQCDLATGPGIRGWRARAYPPAVGDAQGGSFR